MPASKYRVDYDQLGRIAARFGREADATAGAIRAVLLAAAPLELGDWAGPGARAFFAELRGAVLPGLRRLHSALNDAQSATLRIVATARQAEADAADALRRRPAPAWQAGSDDPLMTFDSAMGPGDPPRIYIINGINNRRGNEPGDLLDPSDSMVKLREYFIRNGSDPAQVVVTTPVFNTNLRATPLEGTHFGQPPLESVNELTCAFARSFNALTGTAFEAANTAIGVGQVFDEYASRGGPQTARIDAFVRDDLVKHPLRSGQGIVLLGHSGGGAIAANLAPRLEGENVARQAGWPSPLDVLGVVTLGAPVVNFDAASQVAPVLMLRHAGDPYGAPVLRSDEARLQMAAALLALAAGPSGLGTLGGFVAFDVRARNAGASGVVDLTYEAGPAGAHRSYWQDNSTVYRALIGGLGLEGTPK